MMMLVTAVHESVCGESRGGVRPPRTPKTGREPHDSHGFRCSAADIGEAQMRKERWFGATNPSQPGFCSHGAIAQALELPSRPADQVGIDTQQRRSQLHSMEVA
jgi:hypothetical protein